jgi:uncharacterized Tic20 family protein
MSSPDAATGPELLAERSVLGIFIHPITLFTGFFGVGIVIAIFVYLLSSHQFTRANARNALNWHLSVSLLAIVGLILFVLGADEWTAETGQTVSVSLLPEPLATISLIIGGVLLFLGGVAGLLTIVFSIAATFKAIFGSAWPYPFAPDLLAWLGELELPDRLS